MKTWVTAVAAAFFMSGSWAGLGGAPSNFGAQAVSSRTNTLSTGLASFTVVETRLDSGTTIHEYLSPNGNVFALSWSGPFMPDLKELLGVHFATLQQDAAQPGLNKRSSRLAFRGNDFVIVSTGHMRALDGKAWLPSKLPPGFNAEGTLWPI